MASRRRRVAFDANVLIAALRLPRWPYEVTRSAFSDLYDLVLPGLVIDEARRHAEGPAQATALERFLHDAVPEVIPEVPEDQCSAAQDLVRSLKDVPIALALLAAEVDIFVTNDRDFTDPDATAPRFRERVRVMLPAVFLREVVGWTSEALDAARNRTWDDIASGPTD